MLAPGCSHSTDIILAKHFYLLIDWPFYVVTVLLSTCALSNAIYLCTMQCYLPVHWAVLSTCLLSSAIHLCIEQCYPPVHSAMLSTCALCDSVYLCAVQCYPPVCWAVLSTCLSLCALNNAIHLCTEQCYQPVCLPVHWTMLSTCALCNATHLYTEQCYWPVHWVMSMEGKTYLQETPFSPLCYFVRKKLMYFIMMMAKVHGWLGITNQLSVYSAAPSTWVKSFLFGLPTVSLDFATFLSLLDATLLYWKWYVCLVCVCAGMTQNYLILSWMVNFSESEQCK